ncbi:hypothetical protein N7492_009632 [Penicillium capsulatum]|uniref:Uncharacterized protein n=1 Tax=Penicillium capsulatum TaxID=69766 RepID=A0A9W9HXH8_9EURO|nr:hypothetical protein N7492_009632 [Penicillium capsulatum]KAJ6107018.1 hypothetical protein N7512_010535 [Penicillium capsulatum]
MIQVAGEDWRREDRGDQGWWKAEKRRRVAGWSETAAGTSEGSAAATVAAKAGNVLVARDIRRVLRRRGGNAMIGQITRSHPITRADLHQVIHRGQLRWSNGPLIERSLLASTRRPVCMWYARSRSTLFTLRRRWDQHGNHAFNEPSQMFSTQDGLGGGLNGIAPYGRCFLSDQA